MEVKTKEQIIKDLDEQKISSEGASFYLLLLILEKLEGLNNFINKKGVENANRK